MPEPTSPSTPTKRKRSPNKVPASACNIHSATAKLSSPEQQPRDIASPRGTVADKLVDLQLDSNLHDSGTTQSDGRRVTKKRMRMESRETKIITRNKADAENDDLGQANGTIEIFPFRHYVQQHGDTCTMTPTMEKSPPNSPQYTTARSIITDNTCLPAPSYSLPTTVTMANTCAQLPTPPAPSTLHWQEGEITGQELSGPEDDGYGINGIGFKPTKAMEDGRRMQRWRQITEWKARESAEARTRRAQKRRVSAGEGNGKQHCARKVVRFV